MLVHVGYARSQLAIRRYCVVAVAVDEARCVVTVAADVVLGACSRLVRAVVTVARVTDPRKMKAMISAYRTALGIVAGVDPRTMGKMR